MGRVKFGGNATKNAQQEARTFKVYDGPTPPRGVYHLKIGRMTIAPNKNGDQMISVRAEIDEPAKKAGKTNEKARYNGAQVWDNQNITDESSGYVNAFLEAMGCSKKDILSFWKMGVPTKEDPGNAALGHVLKLGSVSVTDKLHAYGLCDMGQERRDGNKTYAARLEVRNWLTPANIVSSQSDADSEDETDDEVEEVEEEEVDEVEPEEEEEEAIDEEYDARAEELDGLTRTQLKALLKEQGIAFKVLKSTEDDEIREAILDFEFPEEEEEGEEPEEEEEEGEEEEEPPPPPAKTRRTAPAKTSAARGSRRPKGEPPF